jgi:lipopolysaccharide transport system ATP-binding protein
MSSDLAILAANLGKCYSVYDRPHHRLIELLSGRSRAKEFWALRNVGFEIRKGETVGIVGRNGSGKSTLLQILCGTLQPTEGQVVVNGRVAALLELGAGFNPDFSGRENLFLNAALIGMSRRETNERLDEILAFADIDDFIDQPVRTYSSGMFVRLAFAVAISSDPEILVVDEALSVGDEAFQRKCFSRIECLKRNGATILFVSHSAGAVLQLCDRAILLDQGKRLLTGRPKTVVGFYQRLIYAPANIRSDVIEEIRVEDEAGGCSEIMDPALDFSAPSSSVTSNDVLQTERLDAGLKPSSTIEYASRGARIVNPRLVNAVGEVVNVLAPGERYTYTYEVEFEDEARFVHFGMLVKSTDGVELFGMASHAYGEAIEHVAPGATLRVEFGIRASLLPGAYFLNAGCAGWVDGEGETFLHRILDACMFRVELPRTNRRMAGFFDISEEPACSWQVVA